MVRGHQDITQSQRAPVLLAICELRFPSRLRLQVGAMSARRVDALA